MNKYLAVFPMLALAACVTPDVQSRSGVGFQDYTIYQQQQAYLARSRSAPPAQVELQAQALMTATALPTSYVAATPERETVRVAALQPTAGANQTIGTQTLAALGSATAQPSAPPANGVGAPMSAMSTTAMGTEAPASAPLAPVSASGSNIVAFALSTTHGVGQQVYRRAGRGNSARTTRVCAGYASDGLAQEAFLQRGGPERDTLGLDPDGDGYACRWDPSAFRMIRG